MKKLNFLFSALICTVSTISFAQGNYFPLTGNAGIGYGGLLQAPNYRLQVHGTADYVITIPGVRIPPIFGIPEGGLSFKGSSYTLNFGKTARIGLTNTTTGTTATDGLVLQQNDLDSRIENQEKKDLFIGSGNSYMSFSGTNERIWAGNSYTVAPEYGRFNVSSNDNGIYVRAETPGKYGVSVRVGAETDNAIQVLGNAGATQSFAVKGNGETTIKLNDPNGKAIQVLNGTDVKNFEVKGTGEVYARKYTTTLSAIPDYVFEPTYQLMTFSELRFFLAQNKHLPNVPSAKEYTEKGVDLGEMNRVLLEKVEEMTLYILQLEERMKKMEEKK